MADLELKVNGERHRVEVDPATPLLTVLRNDLGLKSAKLGCGLEQCGTCTVLLAGEASLSCRLPVSQLDGREVTTLEGLALSGGWGGLSGGWGGSDGSDELHPLQRAFIAERAAQCGYCIPGMIMAAAALLAWQSDPDDASIRRQLAHNLCRCGAHPRILAAVKRAARELAS